MKIGILTYHFSDNYGALFQAYALRKWFINHGHDAQFINYHPDYVEGGGKIEFANLFSKKNLKIIYLQVTALQRKWFGDKQLDKNFEIFRNQYLGVNTLEFKSLADIQKADLDYDLLVCGSDQIWSPSAQFGLDPVYFLNFKTHNPNVKRISYAPSFGRGEIDDKYHNELKFLISQLNGVSIRERSGVPIIEKIAGLTPTCVPDPTILLEDYTHIMEPYELPSKKHVFCYALRSRDVIGDVAENISQKLGCSLYSPYNAHRRWKEIGETVYPCPRQWLYLLNSSEFVVTNSFHGTALSIILNKPFVVVGLQGGKSSLNARALNLLNLVGLENRFITDSSVDNIDKMLNSPIDWNTINSNLLSLRKTGSDYLTNNLQNIL